MSALNPPAKTWSNVADRVLMSEDISNDMAATAAKPSAPAPSPCYTLEGHLASHAPFLPAAVVAAIEQYEREFTPLDAAYHAAAEVNADAEIERRVNAVRNDPSPENIAALNAESGDELRKKYGERRAIFERLRGECIERNATALSPKFIPHVERVVEEFRRQIIGDFRALGDKYGVRFDIGQNESVRRVEQWLRCFRDAHTHAERAAKNRWPMGWQNWLPLPDAFRSAVMNNLTPMPELSGSPAQKSAHGDAMPSGVSCAATATAATSTAGGFVHNPIAVTAAATHKITASALKSAADVAAARR